MMPSPTKASRRRLAAALAVALIALVLVAPVMALQLSFGGQGERALTVWRPSLSPEPVMRRPRARRLALRLEGDLVLVSVR